MADFNRTIERTTTTVVTIQTEELESLVRQLVGAPADAEIEWDAGYDFLREVKVKWTVTEEIEP